MRATVRIAVVLSFVGLLAASAVAAFNPVMQVFETEGECQVAAPGAAAGPAERGKTYPFGTQFGTGKRGTLALAFSDQGANTCTLRPSTAVTVVESKTDATKKTVRLNAGIVELNMENDFNLANGLSVQTAVGTAETLAGGRYTVEAQAETDVDNAKFSCLEGQLSVAGINYAVPLLEKGDVLSVSSAKDGSYTRLTCEDGQFNMVFRDQDNNPKTVEARPGTVIKIWRRTNDTGRVRIVTILVTRDQQLEEAITYTEPIGEETGVGETTTTVPTAPPVTQPGAKPEWEQVTVTPDTSTTTSTTIPSPTPVGRR